MKKQIEDFYFDMKLPVSAIIRKLVKLERIPKVSVQSALEAVWKQIDTGEIEVERIHIVNTVRKKAKDIDGSVNKDVYTRKYESERKELKELRVKKIKYESIRRTNICDNLIVHGIYAVLFGIVLFAYFYGK